VAYRRRVRYVKRTLDATNALPDGPKHGYSDRGRRTAQLDLKERS
jgi:hypothetical protein